MSFLQGIWATSLILAVWAVLSIFSLLVLRLIRERRLRRLAVLRERLRKSVAALVAGHGSAADRDLVADGNGFITVALDLLMDLEGAPRTRLVELMLQWHVDGRLRHGLRRLNQAKRLGAAEALLFFPSPQTCEALTAALWDRDLEVRLAAAASLVKQDAAPPLGELLPLLTRKGRGIPARLGQILRDYSERHPEAVITVARDKTVHPFIRAKAVETLAVVRGGCHVPAIQSLVMAAEPDLRAAVLRAVAKAPSVNPRDAVAMCLRDQSWFVRAAAADAAGRLGLYDLVPLIVLLVDDDQWWVRFRASEALERLDVVGRRALRQMAEHGSDRQRRQAALTLSKRVVA